MRARHRCLPHAWRGRSGRSRALVLVEGQNVEAHGIAADMTLPVALNFPGDGNHSI